MDEENYMQQPLGYEFKGKEKLVCRLKKSLYGLKNALRKWYMRFDSFMHEHGYLRCESDHCVYFKKLENGSYIILLLYMDDMLIVGSNMQEICELKGNLAHTFAMKDLGFAKIILGMQICRDKKNKKLYLSQEAYINKVLERFNMQNSKPVSKPMDGHFNLGKDHCPSSHEKVKYMTRVPYASTVGSLTYVMVFTRPDIVQAVGVVSGFMANL
ncbi:hypothetical protein KI387_033314, partial [Taxus chinensis]